jgi:hypothetical protein
MTKKPVVQVASDTILDTMKVKAVRLDGMRKGTAIYKRLAKIKPGSTVGKLVEAGTVSRFDLACHVPRGRVVLAK